MGIYRVCKKKTYQDVLLNILYLSSMPLFNFFYLKGENGILNQDEAMSPLTKSESLFQLVSSRYSRVGKWQNNWLLYSRREVFLKNFSFHLCNELRKLRKESDSSEIHRSLIINLKLFMGTSNKSFLKVQEHHRWLPSLANTTNELTMLSLTKQIFNQFYFMCNSLKKKYWKYKMFQMAFLQKKYRPCLDSHPQMWYWGKGHPLQRMHLLNVCFRFQTSGKKILYYEMAVLQPLPVTPRSIQTYHWDLQFERACLSNILQAPVIT